MLFTCTLKNGIVDVPTNVKTEAGFYMRHEPVAVVPAANTDALRHAFYDVESWSAFMRGASEWAINEDGGNYDIVPYRKDPEGSQAWVADKKHNTQFPAGTTRDQVIDQMIKIIQAAAKSK